MNRLKFLRSITVFLAGLPFVGKAISSASQSGHANSCGVFQTLHTIDGHKYPAPCDCGFLKLENFAFETEQMPMHDAPMLLKQAEDCVNELIRHSAREGKALYRVRLTFIGGELDTRIRVIAQRAPTHLPWNS